jgi:hypothetical protein
MTDTRQPGPGRTRFWLGVVSQEHVQRGVAGGFAQLCHGKAAPLRRMRPGDWLVYYSPTTRMGGGDPVRSFTALGRVAEGDPFPFRMSEDFCPFRRAVDFVPARPAPIAPLLPELSFIPDKRRWGFPFRRGHLELPAEDFRRIAVAMGVPAAGLAELG